jgi:hypothetical protein
MKIHPEPGSFAKSGAATGIGGTKTIPKLERLPTDETDTSLVPHPDGTGGVVWGTDSGGTTPDIEDLPTTETDTSLILAPDGAGGVEWIPSPTPSTALWVPVMVEDGATGLWYVAVTGDGDAVMVEVP